MSVERGIYDWLKEHKPLTDVLPAARMFTDTAKWSDEKEIKFPYLVIEGPESTNETRTSERKYIVKARYTFNVWAAVDDLDAGKKAARRLDERLYDLGNTPWEHGDLMSARRLNQASKLDDDGMWPVRRDYEIQYTETF